MKNAFVLVHHIGDQGDARENTLLRLSDKRFGELEARGIVREATAEEIEKGDDYGFVAEAGEDDGSDTQRLTLDVTGGSAFAQLLADIGDRDAIILTLKNDLLVRDGSIAQLTTDLGERDATITALNDEVAKVREDHAKELEDANSAMDEANKRATAAETALASHQTATDAAAATGGTKQQPAASNKKAADPATKA